MCISARNADTNGICVLGLARLDRDAPGLGRLGLGNVDRQEAIGEARLDLLGIDQGRELDRFASF